MPSRSQTRTPGQNPPDGGLSSPMKAGTGTTAVAATESASTFAEDAPTARKPRSTERVVTVKQALEVAQDIVRLCHDAGIVSFIVNTKSGDAAIVLGGVRYCETCRNLFIGAVCQKCESQK